MSNELTFAIDLAQQAGKIMRDNFSSGMEKNWKEDGTPLTATDLAINELVIEAVSKKYPDHSVVGEEGSAETLSDYVWVCDPVDGTIPFSHSIPTFTFSLALTFKGESILGVIYDPMLDRLAYAEKGQGAVFNDNKAQVSDTESLGVGSIVDVECDYRFPDLRKALIGKETEITVFRSCVYIGLLIAMGEYTAVVYEYNHPWDAAAVKIIVEEAGGKVTDIEGNEQRYDQDINGMIASNGKVHEELVEIVKSLKE